MTNYTGGRSNWGCRATSIGLVEFLQSECLSRDTRLDTVALPVAHELDRLHEACHGKRLRTIYSSRRPSEADLDLLEHLTRERFGAYFDVVRDADVVFFQGEGTVGPGNYLQNVRLFGLPFLASRRWKKPVISLNQTIYAADGSDRKVLASIFSGFDLVAVREAASFVFATEMGLSDRLVCCPDMAFRNVRPAAGHSVSIPDRDYFCVTGSAALKKLDEGMIVRAVDEIARVTGLAPVIVHSRKQDREVLETQLAPMLSVGAGEMPDHHELVSILAGAKFVFGGRYHTAVSALSQTTPVILLPGNTFKSEGIADLIGLDFRVFAPSESSAMAKAALDLAVRQEEVRAAIAVGLRRIADMQADFATLVRERLAGGHVDVSRYPSLRPVVRWTDRHRFDSIYAKVNRHRRRLVFFGGAALARLRRSPDFRESTDRTFFDLP
ncbi:polysaccharide pyruvyl transferase family protein [Aquibium sp. ELW1220]|uniref:polysaccharide pyruvyl transferase family protein n=1 Tax=Aquibium sp. ELW1220 TaxID=2976766 RepID=UPI0025AEE0E1|nr:polysaccharide pyruvyl transferase family protein [Aquibium sp. ELW1220]MDN2582359.1 polysaccharide pyruvyl transferase family protein [Aquibium sp. ELW1220]